MTRERLFLGWDRPPLPAAADVLLERFGGGGDATSLSGVVVATPSRGAGRRLLELLIERSGGAVEPPEIVTLGRLPEALFIPDAAVAEEHMATLVRAHALRHRPERVAELTPRPPATDDPLAWWRLAEQLAELARELASARLSLPEAVEKIDQSPAAETASPRWHAVAELDRAYHDALAERGLVDQQAARLAALRAGACGLDRPLVLIGLDDLTPLPAAMIRQLAGPVLALIHAPEDEADAYDDLGVLVPEAWHDRDPGLSDEQLRFVEHPADQARAAAAAVAHEAECSGRSLSPSRVTLGLADPALAGTVRRAFEDAGVTTREPLGRPMTLTPPSALLRALADYAATRRFDALAALLRHPDVDRLLRRDAGRSFDESQSPLTDLDAYATDHLETHASGGALEPDENRRRRLGELQRVVDALLPESPAGRRPLPAWSEAIRAALSRVYAGRSFTAHRPADDATARPLEALGRGLSEHARLDPDDDATPRVDFADALRFAAQRFTDGHVPEPGGGDAVELHGLLELPLDDAPVLVIVGANEGRWPTSPPSFPLLPESLRPTLGLVDRRRRLARDRYRLIAMRHSRSALRVIAGRWSSRGDPLAPSRVLISGDDRQAAAVVERFYRVGEHERDTRDAAPLPALHRPAARDGFLLPLPMDVEPVTRMAVTAFRDYLACPYRFFLKHVLRLEPVDDEAVELTPRSFGNLAHDALERLARTPDAAHATDPRVVEACLLDALSDLVRRRLGRQLRPAVQLQRRALEERLTAFAAEQANETRNGWLIDTERAESTFEAEIDVDGRPFTVTGRLDRVDRHAQSGAVRLLDYKTGDAAKKPEQAHRRRKSQWIDLQLPLYRGLAPLMGIADHRNAAIEVGFVNLPRKPVDVGLALAEWTRDDYDDADARRDEVVRCVRDDLVFWPPAEPPAFPDAFAGLCADAALDRRRLIERSEAERAGRPR